MTTVVVVGVVVAFGKHKLHLEILGVQLVVLAVFGRLVEFFFGQRQTASFHEPRVEPQREQLVFVVPKLNLSAARTA